MLSKAPKNYALRKRITSGIAILLIPALTSVVVCVLFYIFLENNIAKAERITFDNITSIIERDFGEVFNGLHNMTQQQSFNTLLLSSEPLDQDIELSDIQKSLNLIKKDKSFVHEIAMVFGDKFVLTNLNLRTYEQFFFDSTFYYGLDEAVLRDSLSEKNRYNISFYPDNSVSACYINIPYLSVSLDFVVYFNNSKLNSYIKSVSQYEAGGIILEDKAGNAILSGDTRAETEWTRHGGDLQSYLKNKNFQTIGLSDTGLTIYSYIPSSSYGGIIIIMRILLLLSIFASLVIASVMMILNIRKGYRPISTIKEKLLGLNLSEDGETDDIKLIDKNVTKLIENKLEYEDKLDRHKQLLKNNILIRILRNQPLHDTLRNICNEYGFDLFGKKIAVIALESQNIIDYLDSIESPEEASKEYSRITEERHRMIGQYFSQFEAFYTADAERHCYVTLINSAEDDDGIILDNIKRCAEGYQTGTNKTYAIYVSVAISRIIDSPGDLHRAYRQAEDTRIFIEMLGSDNEIFFYDQINTKSDSPDAALYDLRGIRDSIRAKDYIAASEKFNVLIQKELTALLPKQLRCKIYSIVDRLIAELAEATQYYDNNLLQRIDFTNKLLNVSSIESLKTATTEIFKALNDYVSEKANYNSEWIERVKSYIAANYSDINLNVGFLADNFNFNPSYFSRIFKKETGTGVYDYIQEKRIEVAKELLKKENVGDIAVKVGYLDSRTFIRTFKKVEGETPSKYKHK